jgi:hypothetical protein
VYPFLGGDNGECRWPADSVLATAAEISCERDPSLDGTWSSFVVSTVRMRRPRVKQCPGEQRQQQSTTPCSSVVTGLPRHPCRDEQDGKQYLNEMNCFTPRTGGLIAAATAEQSGGQGKAGI